MRFRFWRRHTTRPSRDDAEAPRPSGSETFYDVAMRRLDEQIERRESYSARASNALAVGSTILPVTTGLITLSEHNLGTCVVALLGVSLAAFVAVMIFSMLVLLPGTLDLRPDMETLKAYDEAYSSSDVRTWVARECTASIGENESRLRSKPLLLSGALIGLTIEAGLLAIASLLALL